MKKLIKTNNKLLMWGANIIIVLYIYGDGKILSYNASPVIIYLMVAVILFIYDLLHKDIIQSQNKEVPATPEQPAQSTTPEQPPIDDDPFGVYKK